MRKLEIEIPEGKKAEWVNGVLTLVDEKTGDIMDRIKTFGDACLELGIDHPFVCMYSHMYNLRINEELEVQDDALDYMKLRIIAAALNEGYSYGLAKNESRFFPTFRFHTQKEINEMSEEEKSNIVYRMYGDTNMLGGIAYVDTGYDSSYKYTHIGSRITFKSRKLAEYAGTQFLDIWANYIYP